LGGWVPVRDEPAWAPVGAVLSMNGNYQRIEDCCCVSTTTVNHPPHIT